MAKVKITDKQDKKLTEQSNLAIIYRGTIIHYFTDIEHHIDGIIMRYFCDDDKKAK